MQRLIYDRVFHRATALAQSSQSAKRANQATYWDRFFHRVVIGEVQLSEVSISTVKIFTAYWNKLAPEVRDQYPEIAEAIRIRKPEVRVYDEKERKRNKLKRYGKPVDTSFLYGNR